MPRRLLIEWAADGTDYRVLAEPPDEDFERGWSAIRLALSGGGAPRTAADILRSWSPTPAPPQPRHAAPLAGAGRRTAAGEL